MHMPSSWIPPRKPSYRLSRVAPEVTQGMLQEKRELAKQFSDRTNFESVPVVPEEAEVSAASPEGKGTLESGSNHTTLSRYLT